MIHFFAAEDCDTSNNTNEDGDSISCPLCQEKFDRQSQMESHAMSVHSVNQEGLQRLQSLINGSHWLNQNQAAKQRSNSREEEMEEDEDNENSKKRRRHSSSDDQGKTITPKLYKNEI